MKETNKSTAAFEDYYALGPGRSLAILCQRYQIETEHKPPTRQLSTLKKWSTLFGWQQRVADRDLDIAQKTKAEFEERQAKALITGFALRFQRIEALNDLALQLQTETKEKDRVWLPDVKQIGQGEHAERVDIVRFNAGLIAQFRETLDDIALEMGERVKKIAPTDPSGTKEYESLTDIERANRLLALVDAGRARRDGSAADGAAAGVDPAAGAAEAGLS